MRHSIDGVNCYRWAMFDRAVIVPNMTNEQKWMRLALRLARKGWGRTSPNPMVGAVLVKDGQLLGVGWHRQAGEPHAEIEALRAAQSSVAGATLYVTLEPCCTHGRTPPCVDAIINSGITKVVVGTLDPNPRHQGAGVEILRRHGIEAIVGVERDRCERLNEAFFCWIRHGRPYVVLKMAMTIDGKIATAAGESKWLSGGVSRRKVQRLRQWADAILVGAGTIRADNPSLLVRSPKSWWRQPLRLIASRSGDLGHDRNVFMDGAARTRVVSCDTAAEWQRLFTELAAENITAILVEGGGRLAGELLRAKAIDKIMFFVAPKLMGGEDSIPVLATPDLLSLSEATPIHEMNWTRSGEDMMITGYLTDVHRLH